jgi:hypothetical protein
MYEKITPEFVKECTDYLEFYDEYGYFPWQKKKITITICGAALERIKNKNKSKFISELVLKAA